MQKTEIENFIQLKFYPPVDTDEYVDSIPEPVHQKIFNSTFLSQGAKYNTKDSLKIAIRVYSKKWVSNRPDGDYFWLILKEALIEYYESQ